MNHIIIPPLVLEQRLGRLLKDHQLRRRRGVDRVEAQLGTGAVGVGHQSDLEPRPAEVKPEGRRSGGWKERGAFEAGRSAFGLGEKLGGPFLILPAHAECVS